MSKLRGLWIAVVCAAAALAQVPPPALPAAGWVDLAALVAADDAWQRARTLAAQAQELRAAADAIAPLALPPIPQEPRLPAGPAVPLGADVAQRGREMELQFLRESYLSQVSTTRRRAVEAGLPLAQRQWLTDWRRLRLEFLDRASALQSRLGPERTNLILRVGSTTGPLRTSWAADANALDAAESAVTGLWERAADEALVAGLRARLADQTIELDQQDAEAYAAAEIELADQEAQLTALAARMAAARQQAAADEAKPPLDLGAWAAELAASEQEGNAERVQRAARWRAAADYYAQRAATWTAELATSLPQRLRARLDELQVLAGVRLESEQRGVLPDVTDLARQWLRAYEEEPDWLVPPLPTGPPTLDLGVQSR